MVNNKKHIFSFNLQAYAFTAISFLHIKETISEVIYTDIDPDIIYDEALEGGGLDIDNNGVLDFLFLNSSFTFFSESFSSYRTRQDILAGPANPENALAGIYNHFSTGYGDFTFYYPYALENGVLINSELEWQTWGQQIMALKTYNEDSILVGMGFYCYWYNLDISETIDHYLAIRFLDDFDKNHFGWIRCDIKDNGRTLVIKDYAYETESDYLLVAGDTIQYLKVNENSNNFNAEIYTNDNFVYIDLFGPRDIVKISIYDITGRVIYFDILTNLSTQVEITDAAGIFFIELIAGKDKFTKKIFLSR